MSVYNQKCPVQGCPSVVPLRSYMCARHWQALSESDQRHYQHCADDVQRYREAGIDDIVDSAADASIHAILRTLAAKDLRAANAQRQCDEAIRALWGVYHRLSDVLDAEEWDQADIDLWVYVTQHRAIQERLDEEMHHEP